MAEHAIFAEFGQCLAWAFIDPSSQARNAPIWAPGKKRETLPLCLSFPSLLSLSLFPPRSRGKRAVPAKFAGGSFDLWRNFLVALSSVEFREAARPFRPPFGRAFARSFFPNRRRAEPFSSSLRNTLNPSRVRSRVFRVRNSGRARVLTRGRPGRSIFSAAPFSSKHWPLYDRR